MGFAKMCAVILCVGFVAGAMSFRLTHGRNSFSANSNDPPLLSASLLSGPDAPNVAPAPAAQRYRLDAGQSKFIAHALAGGLLWFKGHDHLVAVREFTGEAQVNPDSIATSSLRITAKAGSMVETSTVFTEPQKQIIDKELREIVLEPAKYPDITFQSTTVAGQKAGNDQYDLKIAGDLTLHGVTRAITIPTRVTLSGNELRAQGEFSIDRGDFKVKATSAMHGLIRARDKVKFTFDIVGHRL